MIKIAGWILAVMLVLLMLCWLLLKIPGVQNATANLVARKLSKSLDSQVSVDRVRFKLFKELQLDGFLIQDQQEDTLLAVQLLTLDLDRFNFWDRHIHIKDVNLHGFQLNLARESEMLESNYQFVLNAFASDPSTDRNQPWKLDIDKLKLTQGRVINQDHAHDHRLDVAIGQVAIYPQLVDLGNRRLVLRQLAVSESDICYHQKRRLSVNQDSSAAKSAAFPALGWEIAVDQLLLENNQVKYDDDRIPHRPQSLNWSHLDARDIRLIASELLWSDQLLKVELKDATFSDVSGFVLNAFEGRISLDSTQILLEEMILRTPNSHLNNSTTLAYQHFSDLSAFAEKVDISADFNEGNISYQDLRFLLPSFRDIKYLNTNDDHSIIVNGLLKGNLNDLYLDHFSLAIADLLKVELQGRFEHLGDPRELQFDAQINQCSTSYSALETLTSNVTLPDAIRPWGTFDIRAKLKGNLDYLKAQQVDLQTGGVTGFRGHVEISNLRDAPRRNFELDVEALTSRATDLAGFFERPLAPAFDSLGVFYYQGLLSGTTHKFTAQGDLISEAGKAQTDLSLDFNDSYTDATFSGDVCMESFDLGRILADTNVGKLSLEVNVFGHGLDFDNLRATVLGEVQELEYRKYIYHNVNVDGRFIQRKFVGTASIDDPNLRVDYEGVVNFADSAARFRFDAIIDTIDFAALNLAAEPLGTKAIISSDFYGNDFNSMQGEIFISDLVFNNGSRSHQTDSFYIFSDNKETDKRELLVQSPHLQATVQGQFSPTELPSIFAAFFDQYFPFSNQPESKSDSLKLIRRSLTNLPGQNFEYQFKIREAGELISIFSPSITLLDSLTLHGHLNTSAKSASLYSYLNQVAYNDMSFGPVTLTAIGEDGVLDNVMTVTDANINDNLQFPFLYLDATFLNDTAYLSGVFQDEEYGGEKLSFAGMASHLGNAYKLELDQSLSFNDEEWQVDPENVLVFGGGDLIIDRLSLSRDSQSLKIQSRDIKLDGAAAPLDFTFSNFELGEIGAFLSIEDLFYEGQINGKFSLEDLQTDPKYLADLKLNQLTLKEEKVGDLIIQSQQRNKDLVDILVRLEGGQTGLDIRGNYNLSTKNISLTGELDRLSLSAVDPFLEGTIHDSQGEISGLLTVVGPLAAPTINGNVEFESVSTVIDYLQNRYTIENENISIDNNRVALSGVTLLDPHGNRAILSGDLLYRSPDDTEVSLKLAAEQFQILNTTFKDNDVYYGTIFVEADVQISGDVAAPKFIVNATTLEGTKFYMQPLGDRYSYAQEDFIIYANPADFEKDTSFSIDDLYRVNPSGIDLTANIVLTPAAELEIIIDPVKGDKLVCHGNAELSIEMDQQGNANVLGNYVITDGSYDFNFQKVLKRNFDIEPGSEVNFIGEPLRSRFDIQAVYPVKTTTYELIRNQSTLSASEENLSRQRTDVEVRLNLSGDLEKPLAKFDITIPDTRSDAVAGSVISKLSQLRENEADMNKQVFGLLILNGFIAEQQATGADLIADAGESALLGSVSSLVSNELNKLAKRYIKGVDLDFGFDSYSNTSDELVTELEVGLSKQLLNDRLTVRLGGNFQFDNQDNFDLVSEQNATFSGDFILEYKLSPAGNYNLKFYQALSNEENVLSPGANYSETGVSLLFSKSFNSQRYLLQLTENAVDTEATTKPPR